MMIWMLVALGVLSLFHLGTQSLERPTVIIPYGEFYSTLRSNDSTGRIQKAYLTDSIVRGELESGAEFIVHIPDGDQETVKLLRENVHTFDVRPPKTLWINIFYSLGPMVLFILFLWFFIYRGASAGGGAGRIWSFGKSRPTITAEGKTKVTFENVAGVDEAKEELQEVIEFLKD
ncbi:MAG: cell division protein FtsH, partial [Candidatus Omnitrophota bacterium]